MFRSLSLFTFTFALMLSALAEISAPGAYQEPIPQKALQNAWNTPIAQHDVARYLGVPARTTEFTMFAGLNEALKNRPSFENKMLQIAEGFAVELSGAELFGPPLAEEDRYAHRAIISSMDAHALRLQTDLSQLGTDAELFVIDPVLPRAFGPYTAADAHEDGYWLPTTEGEWAMVLIRTRSDAPPSVRLTTIAHFYRGFDEFLKQLACNINIACEDNPAVLDIASGVGMLVVPGTFGDQGLCTSTLINNPDTPENEPYVLTANHCVPGGVSANNVDVIWDFRATSCGVNNPPALSSLPRSSGALVLTTNGDLDMTLMELDGVPGGIYGRFYAGWTTRPVSAGEAITGIHHPRASHMRISYGDILASNVSGGGYRNQIEVLWSEGVTEPGSSGLGLLLDSDGYLIIGTLSYGPLHSCGPSAFNTDRFAAFRFFFPQAQGFLTGTEKPDPDDPGRRPCPAEVAFKDQPEVLGQLRFFRDAGLAQTPLGKRFIELYYRLAPTLSKHLERSPESAAAFRGLVFALLP